MSVYSKHPFLIKMIKLIVLTVREYGYIVWTNISEYALVFVRK